MSAPAETIVDAQLQAYVDGQLDLQGRVEVEAFLADRPELAARVLADLRIRNGLQLLVQTHACDAAPSARTLAAARRLERGLSRHDSVLPWQRLAAALVLFALGWTAGLGWNALRSDAPTGAGGTGAEQRTSEIVAGLREALQARPDPTGLVSARLDPDEVGRALSLALPRIPKGWQLVELHIVPGTAGPGVQLVLDAPEFGRLALFAGSTKDVGIRFPTITKSDGKPVATWHLVSEEYMLTGDLQSKPLELAALELYQTLY